MDDIAVIKLNLAGQETWRYPARVLRQQPSALLLEAEFNREDMDVHGLRMERGGRFVEIYYSDRWYNIYEIYGRDGSLRGWYCNVCRPAEITSQMVRYVDLALDLIVFPDGRQLVLDEDEFAALGLSEDVRAQARQALAALQNLFTTPVRLRLAKLQQADGG